MENIEKLRPSEFARLVGVHPSRITALKNKLNKTIYGGTWLVHVDSDNLRFFPKTKLDSFGDVDIEKLGSQIIISISNNEGFDISTQIKILRIVKSVYGKEYPFMGGAKCLGNLMYVNLIKK